MHKDTREALSRLEEELLADETPEMDDEELDALLEEFMDDDDPSFGDLPAGYQNFANGYQVYNTDHVDVDLNVYSDAVLDEPEKLPLGLRILTVAALLGALASLGYILARILW